MNLTTIVLVIFAFFFGASMCQLFIFLRRKEIINYLARVELNDELRGVSYKTRLEFLQNELDLARSDREFLVTIKKEGRVDPDMNYDEKLAKAKIREQLAYREYDRFRAYSYLGGFGREVDQYTL